MGRAIRPANLQQKERADARERRRLHAQVRRLQQQVAQQRPYRATPNSEETDAGVVPEATQEP